VKVFLSWSGERSKSIATALREWLPLVINEVQPFMSSEIDAGARWQSEVSLELESTDFGIICVTSENQDKPWINFEAGALAKSVALGRVVPLAVNLTTAEIRNPLGQFQAQTLTKDGMLRVLLSLNSGAQRTMSQEFIEKSLEKWWPDLGSEIEKVQRNFDQGVSIKNPPRSDRDLLEDILTSVRSLVRQKQDDVGQKQDDVGQKQDYRRSQRSVAELLARYGEPTQTSRRTKPASRGRGGTDE